MIESKLIQLLKTFFPSEIKQFEKFILSPYYYTASDAIALFQFLEKQYPSFKPENITGEKAFRHIYKQKKYDDLRMRHLISLLFKAAEVFLLAQNVKENQVSSSIELMKIYKNRNLPKHFSAAYKKASAEQHHKRKMDLFYYYDQYRIELEEEEFLDRQQVRRETTNLQEVSDHLDAFYIINKLKQSCAIFSYQNVFKQEYQLKMVNEILQHLKTHQYNVPLINLYHQGLLTLLEPEIEDHFFQLKSLLIEISRTIPDEEATELQVISRNYCVKRINSGKEKFIRELFDLYRLGLDSKILLDAKEKLSPSSYKNIVAVGLKLLEFDWTSSFIREYAQKLDKQYQKDYLNLNLAKLHFAKQEYDKVLKYLIGIDYKDIFVVVDARTLLLKTYYELNEYDVLISQLESFRQFLLRRKELSYHSENYLNIIKYIKRLTALSGSNKTEKQKLKANLESEKVLTEKSWLLEKLEML